MTECPDLGALEEAPLPPPISAHVAECSACRMVVDVFAGASDDEVDECLRFDALLAARADGTLNPAGKSLLDRHLASCSACREVAETLSPIADTDGDLADLPEVDPAAYALGLEVARGGMGRILAARDLRVGRPVAVKELLGRAPKLAARFEREARVTARLQHPGIVPIYEIGQWPDGTPFYSMRMVEGHTLLEAIESATTLAARLALLPAVIAATEAVAFAHAQRVIHRDLTPSNVLVGAYGETVVIDWGLAKDLTEGAGDLDEEDGTPAEGSSENLTGVGAVIGTASYMPPEQAHAVPVDERADVYALGSILYHLLAGVPPYRAKSTRELLRDVRTGPPPPISELAPAAPRDLLSIVTKAMARDPDARYPSARELTEELKRFQTGRMVEAHAYSGADRVLRVLRRNKGVVAVAMLAIVLLAAMATVAVSRVLHSRDEARHTVRELLVEEGRVELLNGSPLRALAYLEEAAKQKDDSPSLRFLLASAIDALPEADRLLDCDGDVRSVAISPDSNHLLAACHDHARMWNIKDGTLLFELEGPKSSFDNAAFSHDGKTIVTFGDARQARVWTADTGKQIAIVTHDGGINVAAFTPDDRRLVTIGQEGTAQVWNIATGERLQRIIAKQTGVLYLYGAISTDGQSLFTLSMEGEGRGWNMDTGLPLGGFDHGSHALLLGADISSDGSRTVTCGNDRLAKVWDTRTGAHVITIGGHTDVLWKCVFSPDGRLLLTGGHDGRATIWNLSTGAAITSVDHGDIVLWSRFSPDGRRFLTGSIDGVVRVWDLRSGALLATHDSVAGKDAHFTPDGAYLISQRGDGRIQIWKEGSRGVQAFTPTTGTLRMVSRDGSRAAVENLDATITLHDTTSGEPLAHPVLHRPIAMSHDSATLAALTPTSVAILALATGATRRELPIVAATGLELTEDGTQLLVVRKDAPPELWDIASGQRTAVIADATDARVSRSGRHVLAWRSGASPFVWDVQAGARRATLAVANAFEPLGFSRDEQRVVLIEPLPDQLRRVTLWDTTSGDQLLPDVIDSSVEPTLDPGGSNLTTIGADRVLTVWKLADGSVLASFVLDKLLQAQANQDASLIAGVGDNGKSMVVMSEDGRVLKRTPIEHPPPSLAPTGFRPADATVWWTPRGDRIITASSTVVATAIPTAAEPRTIAMPWRVVGGRLVWIDKVSLRGHVIQDRQPVADATITVHLRGPARHGAGPVDYASTAMATRTLTATTDETGAFSFSTLVPPGPYAITVTHGSVVKTVQPNVGVDDTDVVVDLSR